MSDLGEQMHELCEELFPICRSITGDGLRESFAILQRHIPSLELFEVPTGTKCFDWEVPKEWNIRDAYIVDPSGNKICDFEESNLHVVGYSSPMDATLSLAELQEHLISLPEQPEAIPYATSYYRERWGFCISQNERDSLKDGEYRVFIDSELKDGHLTYGELMVLGDTDEEVFLSTYLCHPSMANNELSGPVVTTFLAKWLMGLQSRKYTYRIVFIPETIGSITYLSKNHERMKDKIVAGLNVTCVGDDRAYSYLPSRQEDTLADRAALHVLRNMHPEFISYSYLDRGSDERQYCGPGMDLPVCSIMRTKYGRYPEYHTSLDDLSLVTPSGLRGGYDVLQKTIRCFELNENLRASVCCEPQLGKRGLYPTMSQKGSGRDVKSMMDFLAYSDGKLSTLEIADKVGVSLWELAETIEKLKEENLLVSV